MKHEFDAGAIVPSTRDLFQVIGTRKRNLAMLAIVESDAADREAARLSELNVSALAFLEPGPPMQLGARSTKTVPTLSLEVIESREDAMRARYFGADGICADAKLGVDPWDNLAKSARTMRMAALALVTDADGLAAAIAAGARAALVKTASAAEAVTLAAAAPKSLTLVAWVDAIDRAGILELCGKVDAAVAPASLHTSPGFASLVAEVDP